MTALEPAPVRAHVAAGRTAGVTEPMIREVVHAFYAKVRTDPELSPIFDRVIGDHWDSHLARMCAFWSSVLLMSGRFKGSPMAAHARIPGLVSDHFTRWLHLFRETAREVCPEAAAALFISKAEMIASSLQLGIAASRGELPPVVAHQAPFRMAIPLKSHQRPDGDAASLRSVDEGAANNQEIEQCLAR